MFAMRSRLAAVALAAALLGSSAPAWADRAEAVKLFDEGRKLRDEGKFDKAARAFEQSIKVEPSIGAYYNLGLVNEQLGNLREAADRYRESRNLARQRNDAREKDAVDALAKLLETNSYVKPEIDDKTAAAPGLRVTIDGEYVPPSLFNGEVFRRREPREAVITAVGRKEVKLALRNKQAFTVVLGEPTGDGAAPAPHPPTAETSGGGIGWQKWTGLALGGAGLITAGIGTVVAIGYYQPSQSLTDEYKKCSTTACRDGVRARADSLDNRSRDRNIVVFSIAGALLVGGILLFVLAPDAAPSAPAAQAGRLRMVPQVGTHDGGLQVVGTF